MKVRLLYAIMFLTISLNAQVWLSEDFDTDIFPPEGWTIDQHEENWKYTPSNYAGGTMGEATLKTLPGFNDITRLISLPINVADAQDLYLSFKYTLKLYQSGIFIGIAKRTQGSEWTTVWETDGHSTVKVLKDICMEENDGAIQDFQICFYFSGASGQLKLWALDDILLYNKKAYDVTTRNIISDTYFDPSDDIEPAAVIYNNGLQSCPVDVNYSISDTAGNILFTETQHVDTLLAGEHREISFSSFTLPDMPDQAYHIEINSSTANDAEPANDTAEMYVYTYVTYSHDMIVLEIGTATWCSACPYASEAAEALIANGYNLALIEYHTNDAYTTPATDLRALDYYAMYGFPTAFFDGVVEQVGAGPNFYYIYFNYFSMRSQAKTGTAITMKATKTRDDYHIQVNVSKKAPVFNKNVSVHFLVTESHIPEEWQNEDELNNVCRLMLPDGMGTQVDFSLQDEITLNYTVTPDSSWNFDELEVVAFVQDNDSHEILNTVKAPLSELSGLTSPETATDLCLDNYPNPFTRTTKFRFRLNGNERVSLQIFDIAGNQIAILVNEVLGPGQHEISWQPVNKPAGIYFARLTAGQKVSVKKLCLQIE